MFYSERLPSAPRSPAAARRVVERLEPEVDAMTLANLRLLVSELVTNAIEHVDGGAEIELDVGLEDGRVHVEVRDSGSGFEFTPRQPGDPRGSGWGLHFVARLTDRWGTDATHGTRVWFEMPARVPAHQA
jgi:anti-sigma regulatory factor (Ser/Thr protein kinase)